jgi:hypothetical protein
VSENVAKATCAWSTGLLWGQGWHGSVKVGDKRRESDACDTGSEAA